MNLNPKLIIIDQKRFLFQDQIVKIKTKKKYLPKMCSCDEISIHFDSNKNHFNDSMLNAKFEVLFS